MTLRTPARNAAVAALVVLLAGGCTGGDGEPDAGSPSPAGEDGIALVDRPHFQGARPVTLAVGQPAAGIGAEGCHDESSPDWVCDREKQDSYLSIGEQHAAALREARMDVAEGGTSWTVTLRFAGPDRATLVDVREEARSRGAVVLVLDQQREVLVTATVEDVERGVIHLSGLEKPDAWDTVELLAAG